MGSTPSFPIRVDPEGEAPIREDESRTQSIEAAAAWRRMHADFVRRGESAIDRWKRESGGHAIDEGLADLQERLQPAKRRAAQNAGR